MKQFSKIFLISCVLFAFASAQSCTITKADDGTLIDSCPSLNNCIDGVCIHKPLFPLEAIEIIGLILVVFITGLASAGGNGGGTILTPILLIFFHYSESKCIMIVYSMIFGGAVGNFVNTGCKRNPKTGKPYLNFDLTLICGPPMLLGTSVGIILNRVVAPIVVIIGLLLLTSYTLVRVTRKARSEYAKETENRREDKLLAEEGLLNSLSETTDAEGIWGEQQDLHPEENKVFQPIPLAKNAGILGFMILLSLFRGTPNFGSIIGIPYCSISYWMIIVVGIFVCLIVLLINRRTILNKLKKKQELQQARRFVPKKGEFELKDKHIPELLALSLLAGVLAGMFGIGGGTVMSPTLLGIGVKAQALSATSGFFVLQTSFISLIAAILYGEVPISVMGFFLGVSCVGAFFVSWMLNKIVKRYQRPSIILFSLIFVYVLSFFATPIYEFCSNSGHLGNLLVFNDFCS